MTLETRRCKQHQTKMKRYESPSGKIRWRCSECRAEETQRRYLAKREEILAKDKARYENDPDVRKRRNLSMRAAHLRKKYGITLDEYQELLTRQNGKCAICKLKAINEKHQLGVDHDHKSGKIRGLLCKRCNLLLGNALDDEKILKASIGYLEAAQSIISPDAERILKRWAKAQYYIYIRPISSLFLDPTKKHKLYWRVQVEFRTVNWQVWSEEGYDLSEIISKLDLQVPKRDTKNLDYKPKRWNGMHAPEAVQKAEVKKAKKKKVKK